MIKPDNIIWQSLDPAIETRLMAVLRSWEGTGYMSGQRAKGMYVDCVGLAAGVLDELCRRPVPTIIPRLPPNSGMHDKAAGAATIKAFRRGFPSVAVEGGQIEPGDVIVTRGVMDEATADNEGHVVIAGREPWTFLHAIPDSGVCWTSIEGLPGLLQWYRSLEKDTWR